MQIDIHIQDELERGGNKRWHNQKEDGQKQEQD